MAEHDSLVSATRRHVALVVPLGDHDHGEVAAIKHRLDRIDRRLEPAD